MNRKVLIVIIILVSTLPFKAVTQEMDLIPQFKNGKYGYVNRDGKKVIAFKYAGAKEFSEGLAAVRPTNGKWGYIDEKGKVVIPFIYSWTYNDEAAKFHKGIVLVNMDSKYFFIDKTGKTVSQLYDYVSGFNADGLAQIRLNNKHGYIDRSGKLVTALYDKTGNYSEELARVELNKKIGYIDKTGKEVIQCKYDAIGNFSTNTEGLAMFQSGEKVGFINKNGVESDMKSTRPELPITFKGVRGEISIIDLKTGKKNGNTFVTLYGAGLDVIPIAFDGSMDYSRMVNVTIITSDEKEYEAASLQTDLLSLTLHFKTPLDPQSAFLYMGNEPDNKIRIDFK